MISELFIYGRKSSVFKDIVAQIEELQMYHVSPDYGYDLNAGNLKTFIKDAKYGLQDIAQKYPICVCITPRSIPQLINGFMWEQFNFTLFFLERTGYNSDNTVREQDADTSLTQDEEENSWARMKIAAMKFLNLLQLTLRGYVTTEDGDIKFSQILNVDYNRAIIRRLSNFNVDKLSGVQLDFQVLFSIAECEIIVGDVTYLVAKYLPETDPIWNSQKTNYYTKEEVDPFKKILGNVTGDIIAQFEHLRQKVRGVTLLNPDKIETEVVVKIDEDETVTVQSEVSMNNYTLIIF